MSRVPDQPGILHVFIVHKEEGVCSRGPERYIPDLAGAAGTDDGDGTGEDGLERGRPGVPGAARAADEDAGGRGRVRELHRPGLPASVARRAPSLPGAGPCTTPSARLP